MANWNVIALVSGNIEAVSGPAAQDRPGTHEWIMWQCAAADKAEAFQSAEKADPRGDLEWMRIRYVPRRNRLIHPCPFHRANSSVACRLSI